MLSNLFFLEMKKKLIEPNLGEFQVILIIN